MFVRGKVWKFGDDINTDLIIPGKYLELGNDEVSDFAMSGIDPDFTKKIKIGDVIVAGKNFGSGSSRETAPIAIKGSGIACVIAESFSRIFFRNAINIGLPIAEIKNTSAIRTGEMIEVYIEEGKVICESGEIYESSKIAEDILLILQSGGLMPYILKHNKGE